MIKAREISAPISSRNPRCQGKLTYITNETTEKWLEANPDAVLFGSYHDDPIDQCRYQSGYCIQEKFYCIKHARIAALDLLLTQKSPNEEA